MWALFWRISRTYAGSTAPYIHLLNFSYLEYIRLITPPKGRGVSGFHLKVLALLLMSVVLLAAGGAGGKQLPDEVADYVFVEFDPGFYMPYAVLNFTLIHAPVVLLSVEREVVVADLGINTTMYVPQGIYLAIPRTYFGKKPPAVPRGIKAEVVDLEVEGLGVVRLALARNATELPNASAVYVFLNAEERGGRYLYRGKPLDVRKPRNNKATEAEGVGDAAPLSDTSKRGTTVYSWARYIFGVAGPAKVAGNPRAKVTYFVATGYDANAKDFVVGRTDYAYLGRGVADIHLFFTDTGDPWVYAYIYVSDVPTTTPPASYRYVVTRAPPFGRAYLLRISTTDYEANGYVWFSAEISNPYNRLVNASIAAVYRRPSPADTTVYSLLTANWRSAVGQPGYMFIGDYGWTRVSRLLFRLGVPQGAQMPINLVIENLRVYTCNSSSSVSVRIYSLADPNSAVTATGYKYVSNFCGWYHFPRITGALPESAAAPFLAGNSTATWLLLEFNPPLSASHPERVYVAFDSFYIYGQRWPEIWSHDSQNWLPTSSRTYAYTGLSSAIVARDYLSYSVWPGSKFAYNDTAPYIRAVAYVTITTQTGAALIPSSPLSPHISYSYVPTDGSTRLVSICLATETGARGLPNAVTLYIARSNANAMLDAVVGAIGKALTAATLILTVFGLPTGGLFTAAGYVSWGLGLLLRMAEGRQGLCGPSGYLGEYYTAPMYDWIRSATLAIGIGGLPITGDYKQHVSIFIRESYIGNFPIYSGNGTYTNFFTYVGFTTYSYFNGSAEPYGGIGWVGYYIPIS